MGYCAFMRELRERCRDCNQRHESILMRTGVCDVTRDTKGFEVHCANRSSACHEPTIGARSLQR